ncbi:MAG TPA: alkaline phosphatase family protein [Chryseolinea sp.]|nr:alkaline phosphatase family protein [Chryseolinea sp.]HPH47098.1 alkaline phosphatase family protein [Chryseolinea sp.]HPM31025.1 alkaline phosphatase family protein [Chryseolinea sp.]
MNKLIIFLFSFISLTAVGQPTLKTENVILITLDGFRWQEVFNGADSSFMRQQEHLNDPDLKKKFWREDLAERRKALLPFFWNTIAIQGQLHGNRAVGNKVNLTNNQLFSYPGYNELLTGKADNERINSNDKVYNPNTNVLEFINAQPAFKGKVAAFSSWDVFPYIINDKRSGVYVSTGVKKIEGTKLNDREKMMNDLMMSLPNPLGDVRLDAFTFYYGMEYLKKNKPRVMYFAFDETDDFAHSGEYGAYLNAAHYTDRFISELWSYLQSDNTYKNKTTIIITCDHGRGNDSVRWKDHGQKIAEADQVWFAVLGPDTHDTGEMKSESQLYQNQIAKTLTAFLGLDYKGEGTIGDVAEAMLKSK